MNAANHTNFQSWAETVYQRPGVETALLAAQDRLGFDVKLLLWCCWTGLKFETIPELVFRHALTEGETWRSDVVAKLRAARQAMKPFEQKPGYDIADMRQNLKTLEISAEFVELSRLDSLAKAHLRPVQADSESAVRARHNLAAYAAHIGAAKRNGFSTTLLHSLIDNIFPGNADSKNQDQPSA